MVGAFGKDADFKVVESDAVLLVSVFGGTMPWSYHWGFCVIEPD